MIEGEREHKYRAQNGETPGYRAFHEVYITKYLGSKSTQELVAFIEKHIAGFKGHIENKTGIPLMLFDRKQDAQNFANELTGRLKIQREHIAVKARKYTR